MDSYIKGLQQKAMQAKGMLQGGFGAPKANAQMNPGLINATQNSLASPGLQKVKAPTTMYTTGDKNYTTPGGQQYGFSPVTDSGGTPTSDRTVNFDPQVPPKSNQEFNNILNDFQSRPEAKDYNNYVDQGSLYGFDRGKGIGDNSDKVKNIANAMSSMGIKTANAQTNLDMYPQGGRTSTIKKSFTTPKGNKYYIGDVTDLANPAKAAADGNRYGQGVNNMPLPKNYPMVDIMPQYQNAQPNATGDPHPDNARYDASFQDALQDFQSRPEAGGYKAYMQGGSPENFNMPATGAGVTPDSPGQTWAQWMAARGVANRNDGKIKNMAQAMPRPIA